jgi:hypothetical protein
MMSVPAPLLLAFVVFAGRAGQALHAEPLFGELGSLGGCQQEIEACFSTAQCSSCLAPILGGSAVSAAGSTPPNTSTTRSGGAVAEFDCFASSAVLGYTLLNCPASKEASSLVACTRKVLDCSELQDSTCLEETAACIFDEDCASCLDSAALPVPDDAVALMSCSSLEGAASSLSDSTTQSQSCISATPYKQLRDCIMKKVQDSACLEDGNSAPSTMMQPVMGLGGAGVTMATTIAFFHIFAGVWL